MIFSLNYCKQNLLCDGLPSREGCIILKISREQASIRICFLCFISYVFAEGCSYISPARRMRLVPPHMEDLPPKPPAEVFDRSRGESHPAEWIERAPKNPQDSPRGRARPGRDLESRDGALLPIAPAYVL